MSLTTLGLLIAVVSRALQPAKGWLEGALHQHGWPCMPLCRQQAKDTSAVLPHCLRSAHGKRRPDKCLLLAMCTERH